MQTIKMTSKRQATFPVELCEDMNIVPGDELTLELLMVDGKASWILRRKELKMEWVGALKKYARNRSHDMIDIRGSIERGRKK